MHFAVGRNVNIEERFQDGIELLIEGKRDIWIGILIEHKLDVNCIAN